MRSLLAIGLRFSFPFLGVAASQVLGDLLEIMGRTMSQRSRKSASADLMLARWGWGGPLSVCMCSKMQRWTGGVALVSEGW